MFDFFITINAVNTRYHLITLHNLRICADSKYCMHKYTNRYKQLYISKIFCVIKFAREIFNKISSYKNTLGGNSCASERVKINKIFFLNEIFRGQSFEIINFPQIRNWIDNMI